MGQLLDLENFFMVNKESTLFSKTNLLYVVGNMLSGDSDSHPYRSHPCNEKENSLVNSS